MLREIEVFTKMLFYYILLNMRDWLLSRNKNKLTLGLSLYDLLPSSTHAVSIHGVSSAMAG